MAPSLLASYQPRCTINHSAMSTGDQTHCRPTEPTLDIPENTNAPESFKVNGLIERREDFSSNHAWGPCQPCNGECGSLETIDTHLHRLSFATPVRNEYAQNLRDIYKQAMEVRRREREKRKRKFDQLEEDHSSKRQEVGYSLVQDGGELLSYTVYYTEEGYSDVVV
ncbi:hypothetical protein K470DRAFT_256217 [Piedraia hortae CBS 480.64]|uniref:Uncharacterized protein n=1 Tax=Piedraia hortae CBS 480.64 TaxID=1314780 RepID=A0A6A7C4U4_9PEZI|nr:hypothetical protein K470DRAFT_256217 [Piedraia hortae CBS 480.64]